ncbi:MAG: hypothetical protein ABIJ96_15350 [Elusimicrobiota bacterium]
MDRFAELLIRQRQAAGFPTAYAFYHRNGGRGKFNFTFAYYAKIERGKALPRGEWLPPLLTLLKLSPSSPARRDILLAYLRDLLGDDDIFDGHFIPLLKSPAAAAE